MPLSDETAGLEEVASAIGRSPRWLKKNWLKLNEAHGFPRKLPVGLVWPRRAVAFWLRHQAAGAANDDGALLDPVAAARKNLEQFYGVAS